VPATLFPQEIGHMGTLFLDFLGAWPAFLQETVVGGSGRTATRSEVDSSKAAVAPEVCGE
jgi:hypothetical protein